MLESVSDCIGEIAAPMRGTKDILEKHVPIREARVTSIVEV
jgi:hypothetical protein